MAAVVVPFANLKPQGRTPTADWGIDHLAGVSGGGRGSPLTGAVQTVERPGGPFVCRLTYESLSAQLHGILSGQLAQLGGRRVYVPIFGYTRRGSGIGSELFTNGDFSNGVTGWSVSAAGSLTAPDYAGRLKVIDQAAGTAASIRQAINVSQGVPYALRSILHDGRGSSGLNAGRFIDGGDVSSSDYASSRGLGVMSLVADTTVSSQSQYPLAMPIASGWLPGDFMECSFASFARCALVDDGPNGLTRSDELDDADWSKTRASVSADATTAPDGTTTADSIDEDGTASSTHYIQQAVTVAATANVDMAVCGYFKASNRTWVALYMDEGTGGTEARGWFNLSAGTVGSVQTGANWADTRLYIADAGDGWYFCAMVARKTNAATTITTQCFVAEGDGDVAFNGSSQESIFAWRLGFAEGSGVPTRPVATTSAATTGTSQTGSALHLKGLPVSTDGILLKGDYVQIPGIDQLVKVTAPLNSDAAGLGYLQFDPMLRSSPADNAPVIDVNPLCRMMLDSNSVRWTHRSPNLMDLEFSLREDVA